MNNQVEPTPVVVIDVRMKFWSMVIFMVKAALAAIPAIVILSVIGALMWGVLLGIASSTRGVSKTSDQISYTRRSDSDYAKFSELEKDVRAKLSAHKPMEAYELISRNRGAFDDNVDHRNKLDALVRECFGSLTK